MRRLTAIVSGMVVAAGFAGSAWIGAAAQPSAEVMAAQAVARRAYWNGCLRYEDEAVRAQAPAQIAAYQRIERILAEGPGDPLKDARHAAELGDFRLIWSSSMGGTSPIGLSCRFPDAHPLTMRSPLTLAVKGYSDVPTACASRPNGCELEQRWRHYAAAYNRAVVADGRFPYADLCMGNLGNKDPAQRGSLVEPGLLSAGRLIETDKPRTLAEAVRRGSPQAMSQWITKADRSTLDHADDFALTPLAWAAIEGRTEAARRLIARGADPMSGCAPVRGFAHTVPLRIALQLGRDDIVALMLRPEVEARIRPWPQPLMEAAVAGNHVALVKRMLREDHDAPAIARLLVRARENGSPAMIAALSESGADAKRAVLDIAASKGDVALLRQALAMKAPVNVGPGLRHSPLGSAVQSGSETTDQIVSLLLDGGADPNSPATWSTRIGHRTGSPPSTALQILVATAQRPLRGHADYNAQLMAAQFRALGLLLDAGASVSGTEEDGRPLVVLLVAGRFGSNGSGDQLPIEWLDRLAAAGMDVNAVWQGSSALDWLDKLHQSDSAMARALSDRGVRRVKPVPERARY